jgi:hypothetical protein
MRSGVKVYLRWDAPSGFLVYTVSVAWLVVSLVVLLLLNFMLLYCDIS